MPKSRNRPTVSISASPQNRRELMKSIIRIGQLEYVYFEQSSLSVVDIITVGLYRYQQLDQIEKFDIPVLEVIDLYMLGHNSMKPPKSTRELLKEYLGEVKTS